MSTIGNRHDITALFSDGGLVGPNPSPKGGTWSWCGVAKDGEHIMEQAGYLLPNTVDRTKCPGNPSVGSDVVSNNDVEWYAAMRALEAMPDGWSGILVSDSKLTLDRLQKLRDGEHLMTFRMDWASRARSAFKKLDQVRFKHMPGHPNLAEQAAGFKTKKDGTQVQVSRHQQWCDSTCTEWAKTYEQRVLGWHTYVEQGLLPGLSQDAA